MAGLVAGAIGLWLVVIWYVQPLLARRSIPHPPVSRVADDSRR
jgi:hypothetical protein